MPKLLKIQTTSIKKYIGKDVLQYAQIRHVKSVFMRKNLDFWKIFTNFTYNFRKPLKTIKR